MIVHRLFWNVERGEYTPGWRRALPLLELNTLQQQSRAHALTGW